MTNKEDLVAKIVDIEWKMFQNVPNIGGRASCQEDKKTFEINRSSQAMNWSEATLESYLGDLIDANNNGRNLLTEKYARMMKSASPQEYARIEHLIPPLNPKVPSMIDKIVATVLEWEEELSQKFPYILRRGRPIYSSDDTPSLTSIDTYLRGELATYSRRTLELYYENILKQRSENINGSEIILSHMMKHYGFNSLEEANEKLSARA
jgi:hypothetical protein